MIFGRVKTSELRDFVQSLSVMTSSGMPIDRAVRSLAEQAKSRKLQDALLVVHDDIRAGTSLAGSLSEQPHIFGPVVIGVVKAGEASGTLSENLLFLGKLLDRNDRLRSDMRAATLYPKIVLAATVLLATGLAVFILPRLVPLFDRLHVDLPLSSRILLAVSRFVRDYWVVTIVALVAVVALSWLANRASVVRRVMHRVYVRIPFFGELVKDYQLALISQMMTTLLHSGLPISTTLQVTGESVTNLWYQETLWAIKERTDKGVPISESMVDYPQLFPESFISIVEVGEQSGTLENSFKHLTRHHVRRVNIRIKRLPTVVEPILLVIIGITVGFVAISIITPIYGLLRGIQ